MTKYEACKAHFEIKASDLGKKHLPGSITAAQIEDAFFSDPDIAWDTVGVFDTMEEAEKALASCRVCTSRGGWAVPCFFGDVAFVNEYEIDEEDYDPEDPSCLADADDYGCRSFRAEAIEDRRAADEEEE